MHVETFQYHGDSGWSVDALPTLAHAHQLLVVFGAPRMDKVRAPLDELIARYGGATVCGCSTAGEIFQNTLHDETLTVALVGFDHARLASASVSLDEIEDDYAAGKSLANALSQEELVSVYVLSDGLNVNGSELVRGINDALGDGVIVTGGLAGDGSDFGQTWVLDSKGPKENQIVAVGFYGSRLTVSHGSRGGWDTFGPMRRITRSEGNVLYELDDQPALELYKRYLGERAKDLPGAGLLFPLAIRAERTDEHYLVRTILGVDEETNSLTFAGDIPQGRYTQLMKTNYDRLVDGAESAAREAVEELAASSTHTLSLAVSCVGRRLVMGDRIEEELEATLDLMPEGTHQVGFYSYGELSPIGSARGATSLHNQTMTLTVIRED